MVRKFLARANSSLSVGYSAALLSSLSLVTMFLGLFREHLLMPTLA